MAGESGSLQFGAVGAASLTDAQNPSCLAAGGTPMDNYSADVDTVLALPPRADAKDTLPLSVNSKGGKCTSY